VLHSTNILYVAHEIGSSHQSKDPLVNVSPDISHIVESYTGGVRTFAEPGWVLPCEYNLPVVIHVSKIGGFPHPTTALFGLVEKVEIYQLVEVPSNLPL